MAGLGVGGNAKMDHNQLALTANTAAQIPFPTNGTGFTGLEGAVRHITAGNADVYLGKDANVTTANGFRIPANQMKQIYMRGPVYVVAGAGTTISWMEEYN